MQAVLTIAGWVLFVATLEGTGFMTMLYFTLKLENMKGEKAN